MENRGEIVVYQTKNGALELKGDSSGETIWASLDQIAKLFGRDKSVISRHIKNGSSPKRVGKLYVFGLHSRIKISPAPSFLKRGNAHRKKQVSPFEKGRTRGI